MIQSENCSPVFLWLNGSIYGERREMEQLTSTFILKTTMVNSAGYIVIIMINYAHTLYLLLCRLLLSGNKEK